MHTVDGSTFLDRLPVGLVLLLIVVDSLKHRVLLGTFRVNRDCYGGAAAAAAQREKNLQVYARIDEA
jgi:hypothetical protein